TTARMPSERCRPCNAVMSVELALPVSGGLTPSPAMTFAPLAVLRFHLGCVRISPGRLWLAWVRRSSSHSREFTWRKVGAVDTTRASSPWVSIHHAIAYEATLVFPVLKV